MDPLSALVALLDVVRKAIEDYRQQQRAAQGQPWKLLLVGLESSRTLTVKHVEAIRIAVDPLIGGNRDIEATCRCYHALVNEPSFPTGYDFVHGVIGSAHDLPQFQKEPLAEKLRAVTRRLGDFQQAAFVLQYYNVSYGVDDAFEKARELWSGLSSGTSSVPDPRTDLLRDTVRSSFERVFRILPLDIRNHLRDPRGANFPLDAFPLDRPEDVVELVSTWCRGWQRYVQDALYGGHGLHSAVGAVMVLAPPGVT